MLSSVGRGHWGGEAYGALSLTQGLPPAGLRSGRITLAAVLLSTLFGLAGLVPGVQAQQPVEVVFEDGVEGYTGTRDNTIYQEGTNTNGGGQYLFAGRTAGTLETESRRALLTFDVSLIPPGSSIDSVTLELRVSKTLETASTQTLHRLLKDWGEGIGDAPLEEGRGTVPAEGDATWVSNFHNLSLWDSPGGDFVATPSASTSVGLAGTTATWTGSGLVADVQAWVDGTAENFGWILIGNESALQTTKRFNSADNTTVSAGQRPRLTVSYLPPEEETPTPTATLPPTATPTETPTPTATPTFTADLNGDGRVDADDLYIFILDWQRGR